jgi:dolichyl-phosphate beta-glucosyltransferase
MISLVIPVYNYEEKLPQSLEHLRSWLKGRTDVQEILFVNDGSIDGTARILANLGKPMRVVTLPSNRGKGAAVRAGALAATGDHIFFTDIDMPYDLKAIDLALEKFKTGAAMVSGSRNAPGSGSTVSRKLERRVSSIIFSRLANLILIHPVADTQCGLKGFTREAARAIFPEISANGYVFDVEIWYIAQHKEFPTALVPVTLINDSNSSVNVVRDGAGMALGLFRLYARTRTHITRRDALFIGGLGGAMALLLLPTLQNLGALSFLATHGLPVFFTVVLLVLLLPFCMLAGALGLSLLPLHKHSAAQFSRYGVVGAYNTVLNAAIFNSLIFLSGISQGPWVTVFALITFAIVITQAFFWNIFWTFHHSSPQNRKQQYIRFFAVTSTTALVNLGLIHIIVNVIGPPGGLSTAVWANCALLFTIFTAVIGNFFGYKFFVFAK